MPCQELVERVTDYLEGAISDEDRARLEAHLAECDPCETYLAQLRVTLKLVGALGEQDVADTPPQLRRALMESFTAWRDEGRDAL